MDQNALLSGLARQSLQQCVESTQILIHEIQHGDLSFSCPSIQPMQDALTYRGGEELQDARFMPSQLAVLADTMD